jgi:hypothetical protein
MVPLGWQLFYRATIYLLGGGGGKNIITYLMKKVSETKRRFTTYILLYKIIYFLTPC